MSRYDATFDETWDLEVPTDKGFPYNFPFYFDRENTRSITDSNETWSSDISQSGRNGATTDETWSSSVSKTGRYGSNN